MCFFAPRGGKGGRPVKDTIGGILLMAGLILLSAFFSAAETAYSSASRTRLRSLAEKGNRRAGLACALGEEYDQLLSAILIGNNLVNIGAASLGTVIFVRLYGDVGATISTAVVTVVVLIFGEISPKSLARECPERFALFSAPLLRGLIWIMTPLNYAFTQWKKVLSRLLRLERDCRTSREELLMLVEEVQQDGSIDQNEGELLRKAIGFSGREAAEILTPRVDLKAVDVEAGREELARQFSQTGLSRILVYDGSIDNIVGLIHQKDFYSLPEGEPWRLKERMTRPVFVWENEKIHGLLHRLQRARSHVAVVLDEYGGTLGIVTMEDILEELVGEIWDEHDQASEAIRKQGPGVYRASGSVDLADFSRYFSCPVDSAMVSLGGWIMERLGRVPGEGDRLEAGDLELTVRETKNRRITWVEIRRMREAARLPD